MRLEKKRFDVMLTDAEVKHLQEHRNVRFAVDMPDGIQVFVGVEKEAP